MPTKSDAERPDLDERIRAEVDRAVAPYVGIAPPFMIAKMRELVERYWRENPVAVRSLQLKGYAQRPRSGTEVRDPSGGAAAPEADAGAGGKKV